MEEATRAAWEHHLQNIHSLFHLASNPHLLLLGKLIQADWARGVGRRLPKLPSLRRRNLTEENVRKLEMSTNWKVSEKTWMAAAGIDRLVISWANLLTKFFKHEFANQIKEFIKEAWST